jgi:hypothetical protein
MRVFFGCGIALLVTGSCFIGSYTTPNDVVIGEKLVKAGYLVLAGVLAVVATFTGIIRRRGWAVSPSSIKVCRSTSFPQQLTLILGY